MQQSFFMTFPFVEKSLTKPIEELLVLPENTIGAYILRKKGNMRRITIYIPRINYERSLQLVFNDTEQASGDISFFNFICSLQKCAIKMNTIASSNPNVSELRIEIIAYGEDVKFIKNAKEKLSHSNN